MFGLEFTRNQKLALIALIAISTISLSYAHHRNSVSGSGEVVLLEPTQGERPRVIASDSDTMPFSRQEAGKVVFQVAGCVNKPGVYTLPMGERVMNAIAVAGGAKPHADLQNMNLAEKIVDGSRIYVPAVNEAPPTGSRAGLAITPSSKPKSSESRRGGSDNKLRTPGEGIVHINSADATELQRLPGVGPATAEKIATHRTQIGRFTQPEQIMDVKGIGPKKYEKMRPFVAL